MIQSKLTDGSKVITEDKFPEAATLRAVPKGGVRTSYCDNEYVSCQITENRIGRFMLLEQNARCHADSELEVKRTGVPVLMMSLAKDSNMIRTNGEDRLWRTGDVCLSMSSREDVVVNHCQEGSTFNLFNIVVPEPVVRLLAERYPDALGGFCRDFEQNKPRYYTSSGMQVSQKLLNTFRSIEHYSNMGSYGEKYLESKILDCLSIMLNRVNDSEDELFPINFVLQGKVHDARDIILAQYKNPPSLHELATMVGTNECTLKSAFKKEFGTTVFQYMFDYRMQLAAKYLLNSSLSVAEIGVKLGYDYQSHFCTAFRRMYGVSPSDFRVQSVL